MNKTILARACALVFALGLIAAVLPSQAQAFDPDQGIRNYFATLSTLDFERYVELYTPDGTFEDPVGGPVYRGHKAIFDWVNGIGSGFSQLDFDLETIIVVSPTEAAVPWIAIARTVDGRTIQFEGIGVFVFNEDGKLRHVREYWDLPGVLAQLAGVPPQPRSFPFQAQVDSWFALGNALDFAGYVDLFTHDGILHDPVGIPPYRSHGKILEHVQGFQDVFLSLHREVIRSIPVSDTEIALQWTLEGTMATGNTVHLPGMTILRFNEEGKIRSAEELWSLADFLSQL
jgi:steroid Delta-isomerase